MISAHLLTLGEHWQRHRHPKWMVALVLVTSVLPSACVQRVQPTNMSPAAASEALQAPSRYVFAPEDVIEVSVWKNPDLSREVTVRSDGKISLPLIGDVDAAGLTTEELADAITQALLAYYQESPAVSIIVTKAMRSTIYVLGEVKNQGKFEVTHGTTLLQAIALAGGFSEFASRNNIIMRRKGVGGEEITLSFRYKDILSGREENILIQHGDTIIVP